MMKIMKIHTINYFHYHQLIPLTKRAQTVQYESLFENTNVGFQQICESYMSE